MSQRDPFTDPSTPSHSDAPDPLEEALAWYRSPIRMSYGYFPRRIPDEQDEPTEAAIVTGPAGASIPGRGPPPPVRRTSRIFIDIPSPPSTVGPSSAAPTSAPLLSSAPNSAQPPSDTASYSPPRFSVARRMSHHLERSQTAILAGPSPTPSTPPARPNSLLSAAIPAVPAPAIRVHATPGGVISAPTPPSTPTGYMALALAHHAAPRDPERRRASAFWRFVGLLIDSDTYRYNPNLVPPMGGCARAPRPHDVSVDGTSATDKVVSLKPGDKEGVLGARVRTEEEEAAAAAALAAKSGAKKSRHRLTLRPAAPPAIAADAPTAGPATSGWLPTWLTPTTLLTAILVSVFVAELFQNRGFAPLSTNPLFGVSLDTLAKCGGTVTSWVRLAPRTHAYRLLTGPFLHAGIVHLFINLIALWVLGPRLQMWFGAAKACGVYLFAMVGGQLVSVVLHKENIVVVGASGAICGLVGAVLAEGIVNWKVINHPKFQLGYWGTQLALYLAIGALPLVDNLAHVGECFLVSNWQCV
ncbi:hypothetical protein HDU96_003833 [Phlyctochytrium bullatum]|nr:hypothetical protein HDU96_003833 [Phlyctochytrium bullatum]